MFGLGFAEIVVICLVVLIIVRPKDLPRLFRKAGALYRQVSDQLKAASQIVANMDVEERKDDADEEGGEK
jgi:Sec-independent protein translocase protein TatA